MPPGNSSGHHCGLHSSLPLPQHAIFRQFSVPFLPEPSFIRDTKNISSQETKAEAMFPKLLAALKLKNTYMVQKISGTKEAKEAQQQDEEAGQESCSWGSCSRSCKEGATQRFVIERCQVAGKHTQTHTAGVLKKEMLHWQKIIETNNNTIKKKKVSTLVCSLLQRISYWGTY